MDDDSKLWGKKNNGKNGKVRLEIWTCPKDGDAKVVAMII